MDGLEAVEFSLSMTKRDKIFRFDAEHYGRSFIELKNHLGKLETLSIHEIIEQPVMTGHTPSMEDERYYGGTINFIKTDNVRNSQITKDFNHHLSTDGNKKLSRTSLRTGDVVVTIIGATHKIVGRAALIYEDVLPANINQNIALIRVHKKRIIPEYLSVYLNTRYGRGYLHYLSRQTEQVNLNCREVEQLVVPIFSPGFQERIRLVMESTFHLNRQSQNRYRQAEDTLLEHLGLKNWKPSEAGVSVKSFAESFGTSARLDAEHYQPKYDELIGAVEANAPYYKKIKEFRTYNARGLQPEYVADGQLDVINSRHILEQHLDYENFEKTDVAAWREQVKAQVFENDILTYRGPTLAALMFT